MKNVKVKEVKKWTVGMPVILALLIIFGGTYVLLGHTRTVSATGVCVAKIPRDKFSITLQIQTLDRNAAVSLRAAQAAADDVARRIRTIEDSTLEIQTTNLFSFEKTEWRNNSAIPLGIQSQIDLEVTSSNRETINAVLEIAKNVPNAQIFPQNMRNFSSREVTDKATEDCLQTAIQDARDKAFALASGDGERLGRLVSAQFGTAQPPHGIMPRVMAMRADMGGGGGGEFLQSAEGDLSIRVEATFRIK